MFDRMVWRSEMGNGRVSYRVPIGYLEIDACKKFRHGDSNPGILRERQV
jgi:hypothetical protein